ncbi:MAG: nitroreductase family deazaflavin-dependent oxidoreductase [Chloroflexi bacterium]|nr:nitroreductase family deazaflavin-dependent oxidoreductase [Chloroflexota bacterium]
MSDFNKEVIQEFRDNDGKVGGFFENMDLLLIHTTGAKSGQLRINPTAFIQVEDHLIIAASKGGADSHPDWYHNLVADPQVIVEVGTQKFVALAEVPGEPERTNFYSKLASKYPGFAEYEAKTERVIPIVKLTRQ